jgi:DNA polymerase III epsilon subunit-like protein
MPRRFERFIAIDVEIARRVPVAVCAIAAARFESGRETDSFRSFVRYAGRVRYGHIHGITGADLRNAPPWPAVWHDVLKLVGDVTLIVAYRAAFDRAAIMTMCAGHTLRMPRIHFVCAAEICRERFGRAASLAATLQMLGVPFPGRPHDPLADARAAAALVLALDARED